MSEEKSLVIKKGQVEEELKKKEILLSHLKNAEQQTLGQIELLNEMIKKIDNVEIKPKEEVAD